MLRIAFLVLLAVVLALSTVSAQDVDTRLCEIASPSSMGSWSTTGEKDTDWVVTTITECTPLPLKSLDTSDPKLAAALEEWKQTLWQEKTMEITEIYRYRLTIENDGKIEAVVGLFESKFDFGFLFSSYTSMAKSLEFRVPPCSRIVMSFLAPGAPKRTETQFVIAGDHLKESGYGWMAHSGGRVDILLPMWEFLAYEEGMHTELLRKGDAKTLACR